MVAPFTGAWIEMPDQNQVLKGLCRVAPFTGAWIEIKYAPLATYTLRSVAPFTGAWIEIKSKNMTPNFLLRRTLHGCVD